MWIQASLCQGLVEICKVAVATLNHEQIVDLVKTPAVVTVTVLPPVNPAKVARFRAVLMMASTMMLASEKVAVRGLSNSSRCLPAVALRTQGLTASVQQQFRLRAAAHALFWCCHHVGHRLGQSGKNSSPLLAAIPATIRGIMTHWKSIW